MPRLHLRGSGDASLSPPRSRRAGTQSIAATDINLASNINGTESGDRGVQATRLQSLAITGFPTSDTAGADEQFTVTTYDAYGNIATGYVGTVQFTSTDPLAVIPAPYAFTASDEGRHTFTATLRTAGARRTCMLPISTSSSISSTESGIVVQAASAAQSFRVAGFPTSDLAGAVNSVTVTAVDAFGNVATGYAGTVTLSSSDPHAVLPASYVLTAADAGQHRFAVTLDAAGMQSISATDESSLTGSESDIDVESAAATALQVTHFPTSVTAGETNSCDGDRLRRLRQRGDRLHRYCDTDQQ